MKRLLILLLLSAVSWGTEPPARHPSEPTELLMGGMAGEGLVSRLTVLRMEERALLTRITGAARDRRELNPEEAGLLERRQESADALAELHADDPSPERDIRRLLLREEIAKLDQILILFPAQQGAEELVARLRLNLRCRLALAELLFEQGFLAADEVEELRHKLALCPVPEGSPKDDSATDMQTARSYLLELKKHPSPMIRGAEQRFREGLISSGELLKAEATLLHIRIIAQATLPLVRKEKAADLELLKTNLQRQLEIARASGREADALELQEKLSAWFPES